MATMLDRHPDFALEVAEWQAALDDVLAAHGAGGALELLRHLHEHALASGLAFREASLNTPYVNTIPVAEQPAYPGDIAREAHRVPGALERHGHGAARGDSGSGVGGHIATYASAATLLEVGFQHCFRAPGPDYGGDVVIPQPHAAPGLYARAFLEGRLPATALENFRRELAPGGGLPSYPHPRSLPDFWQVPCASMGLSTPTAIYLARFAKYLEHRGLKPANGGRVWCFIGDGEADEPEVLGTVNIAARGGSTTWCWSSTATCSGSTVRCAATARSSRNSNAASAVPTGTCSVIWGSGWDGLLAQDTPASCAGAWKKRSMAITSGTRSRPAISNASTGWKTIPRSRA